jgi:hypothetical protein
MCSRVFVAQIDVDLRRLHDVGADQHALNEAVRIRFEIISILERAGLALVAIDRHQPWPGLAQHRAPFAPRGKTGAAETAQGRVVEDFKQILFRQFAGAQPFQQRVASARDIGIVIDIGRQMRVGVATLRRREHALSARVIDEMVPDLRRRRGVAASDAGRAHDPYSGTGRALQFLQQLFGAQHRAGQRVADPDGQRGNIELALLHHVEMRVEGRRLEHLREGELHLVGQRREVGSRNLVPGVLDEMQMLDQQIAPPRPVAE